VSDLSPAQCSSLYTWMKFYQTHKTYKQVGVLHGRYYDANGYPTQHYHNLLACNKVYEDDPSSHQADKDSACIIA
jgi:hypothetical protein